MCVRRAGRLTGDGHKVLTGAGRLTLQPLICALFQRNVMYSCSEAFGPAARMWARPSSRSCRSEQPLCA